jgi:hypothetical protein
MPARVEEVASFVLALFVGDVCHEKGDIVHYNVADMKFPEDGFLVSTIFSGKWCD